MILLSGKSKKEFFCSKEKFGPTTLPSVQSFDFEVKIDKLYMEKSSNKNVFTAPRLRWTVSPLDACAQSQNNAQNRTGTRGRNA